MTVRKVLTAMVVVGVGGSAVAQESPTNPAPQSTTSNTPPAVQQPAMQPQPMPYQVQPAAGMMVPQTFAPGVVQGSYTVPMTYGYPQGQIVQTGFATTMGTGTGPAVYGTPMASGTSFASPTAFPMAATNYGYPVAGGTTMSSSGGFVTNVVAVPKRVARRLLRR